MAEQKDRELLPSNVVPQRYDLDLVRAGMSPPNSQTTH